MMLTYYHRLINQTSQIEVGLYSLYKCSFIPLCCLLYHVLAKDIRLSLYLYFLFALLGDFFLMFYSFSTYAFGGLSFLISHLIMSYALGLKWSNIKPICFVLMIPGILLYIFYLLPSLLKGGAMNIAFFIYMLVIEYASCCSAARLTKYGYNNPVFYLPYIGYQLFIISDCILLKKKSINGTYNTEFQVMGTYILAQLFITIGMALQPKEEKDKQE